MGATSVLWRISSTVRDTVSTVGVSVSTVGDNISSVDVAQYSRDKDAKYYKFSNNLRIFSRVYFASKSDRSGIAGLKC